MWVNCGLRNVDCMTAKWDVRNELRNDSAVYMLLVCRVLYCWLAVRMPLYMKGLPDHLNITTNRTHLLTSSTTTGLSTSTPPPTNTMSLVVVLSSFSTQINNSSLFCTFTFRTLPIGSFHKFILHFAGGTIPQSHNPQFTLGPRQTSPSLNYSITRWRWANLTFITQTEICSNKQESALIC